MKLLLKIKYLGGGYCGFQVQPAKKSVQGELCRAFGELFGFPCNITGCSRTDSGVHAEGFCAVLEPKDEALRLGNWCTIPPSKLHRAVNIKLPPDISVTAAAEVPEDFHPRYGVHKKRYEYRISDSPARDPFLFGRVLETSKRLTQEQIERMDHASKLFVGEHDFSGFMSTGSKITDTVRCVYNAGVERKPDGIVAFSIEANGFLYNMVRIMAGTLIDLASGKLTEADITEAIECGNRRKAGFTAAPEGLYLTDVTYDIPINWLSE